MSTEKIQQDINWIKQLAEEGRNQPLSDGIIGIWWAVLTSAMMLLHWATLTGLMPFAIQYIGFVWITYSLIGYVGTMVLVKKIKKKGGGYSLSDRVSSASWSMFGAGITSFFIGVAIAVFYADAPYWVFNIILPVSFFGYGIANGVTAMLSKNRASGFAAALSFLSVIVLMSLLMTATIYLVAAIAVLIVIMPPSLLSLSAKK
ncbi:MAG: hypothetical protein L3J04_04380 [Robiginitomaculum sp.]|nr:hypothetical protein [Robiginitomaculum sp.]